MTLERRDASWHVPVAERLGVREREVVQAVSVLVIGAGPTGLLAAAELRRRGVDRLIIDGHERPMEWDRPTVVHPRSLEIFESLGIVEPLVAAGVRQRRARIHASGGLLGEIELALCGSRYPGNIGISEEVTEAILRDYLTRQGGEVTRARKLVAMEAREDGVLATIEHEGVASAIFAQWVLGCDGYHSTVRTLAAIGLDGHDIAEPWAVFDAGKGGWTDSFEGNYAHLDETPVILTSLPGRRWRVYLRPTSAESDLALDALTTPRRYLPEATFWSAKAIAPRHCSTATRGSDVPLRRWCWSRAMPRKAPRSSMGRKSAASATRRSTPPSPIRASATTRRSRRRSSTSIMQIRRS